MVPDKMAQSKKAPGRKLHPEARWGRLRRMGGEMQGDPKVKGQSLRDRHTKQKKKAMMEKPKG